MFLSLFELLNPERPEPPYPYRPYPCPSGRRSRSSALAQVCRRCSGAVAKPKVAKRRERQLQGCLAHPKQPPCTTLQYTVALCVRTFGDPREVGVSYERGTPVAKRRERQTQAAETHGPNGSQHRYWIPAPSLELQGYLAHKNPPPP